MAEQRGKEKAATVPAIPVGSKRAAISAVTLIMSAGWGLVTKKRLITSRATLAVLATVAAFLKKLTTFWLLL